MHDWCIAAVYHPFSDEYVEWSGAECDEFRGDAVRFAHCYDVTWRGLIIYYPLAWILRVRVPKRLADRGWNHGSDRWHVKLESRYIYESLMVLDAKWLVSEA